TALLLLVGCTAPQGGSTTAQTPVDCPCDRCPAMAGDRDSQSLAEERATWQQLQRPISVQFDDTPLREALDAWNEQAQVNMVVDWESLAEAGVEPDKPVRLSLTDMPAEVALKE